MSKLEEAASKFADEHGFRVPYNVSGREITNDDYYDKVDIKASMDGFISGAEWQKDNMWISVEESLPECVGERPFSEDVLIVNHGFTVGYYYKPNNQWYSNLLEDVVIAGVTHWMPIPKHDVNH